MMDLILQEISALFESIRALGAVGAAVYALIFLLATLVLVPASPLTAIAGFLYGPLWGTLLVSPLGIVSAALAFLIGRSFARPWVQRHLDSRPRLTAMDRAVAREGFRLVLLLRLSSVVPFAPLSYGLSASRISARDFMLASWLGLLPGTFLYVYLGSLVSSVGQILRNEISVTPLAQALTWVGLAAGLIALWTIARFARQAVQKSFDKEPSDEQTV
ncbi:TVP38/TMEM64 family protein [Pectobacterium aroidearum]